jgi:hypothetical protein
MNVPDLHLSEISFKETPTKSQLVNALRDIQTFLGRVGGSIIADGSYSIADQPVGVLLNASVALKQSADLFEAGPNASGLAVPGGGPQVVGRR